MIHPEWVGETCFILGGGPSLLDVPIWRLRQLKSYGRVIVINDSYRLVPDADVLYFCDAHWWQARNRDVEATFTGRKIITMVGNGNSISDVISLRNTGATGLETDPGAIRHGHNSGYAAINVAAHFGCRQIVLLGYDMHVAGTHTHWHDTPVRPVPPDMFERSLQRDMLPNFNTLKAPLEKAGVRVVNSTPASALTLWPYVPLKQVLNEIVAYAAN